MLSQSDQGTYLASDDRRRHPRVCLKSDVSARRKDIWMDTRNLVSGSCCNLSMGGIQFEAEEDFPLGTLLELNILLDGWNRYNPGINAIWAEGDCEPLSVACEVLRTEKKGGGYLVAARFVEMQPYDFIGLHSYLMDHRATTEIAG